MALTKITPQMFDTSAAGHDFNIDNGTFVVDASTNRVGIGTSSPATALDVTGTVTADDVVIQSDGATVTISSADHEVALLGRRGSSGADLDKGFLRLKDTGTTKVAIDSAGDSYFNGGNVGIGTASPSEPLTVLSAQDYQITAAYNATNSTSYGYYGIKNNNTGNPFYFNVGGAERLRIDSSGNVGIGTSSPSQKLHVYQSSTSSQAYVTVQNNRSRNAAVLTQTTNGGFYTGTSIGTDSLCWQVYDASAGERMRIDSSGNVGIGTSSPAQKLHISGTGFSYLRTTSTSYGGTGFDIGQHTGGSIYLNNRDNTPIIFQTNNTERMRISGGNVGIGTSSPNGKLQFDNGLDTRKIVLYEGANNNYQFYGFGIEGSTLVYSTYASTDDHVFFSGASASSRNELMRIKGTGNVDISSGYITSQVPAFNAYNPAVTTSGNIITFGQTRLNQGNHFNTTTGAFTAPVDGVYHFTFAILASGSGSPDYHRILFEINTSGTQTSYGDNLEEQAGSQYSSAVMSITIYLNQNDYIRIRNQGASTYGTSYGSFSGHLVG